MGAYNGSSEAGLVDNRALDGLLRAGDKVTHNYSGLGWEYI